MKKIFYLMASLCFMFYSCSSPEKKAEKIVKQFQSSLEQIASEAPNIDAYQLNKLLLDSKSVFDLAVSTVGSEITDPEKREIFDNIIDIDDITSYETLLEELANKNISVLQEIRDKKWINKSTSDYESIFTINSAKITFLNLAKSFTYSILDGNIVFDEQCGVSPLFFSLNNGMLTIRTSDDRTVEYREPTLPELVLGKWKNPNTTGGQYNGTGVIFKTDGKSVEYGYDWQNATYKVNGNTITHTINPSKFYGSFIYKYTYNASSDRMVHEYGAQHSRVKENGPDCLTFLFDGNKTNEDSDKPEVKSSSSSKSSDDGDNEWDKIIDEYEIVLDKYIVAAKKAKAGDMSVLSDVTEIMEKLEKLEKKLSKAGDKLSTKQAARYAKVAAKFASAAAGV